MPKSFLQSDHASRPIDVTTIENALVDMLVRAEDSDVRELGMTKGVMQLVDAPEQARLLASLGKLTAEVELGGSGANAMRGMALLGARVSYSSAVGRDEYGKAFSARLDALGIRNRLAVTHSPTGTCVVVVTPDSERTLNTHLGACREYRPDCVPVEDVAQSKFLFTTGYMWDTPNQIDAIQRALKVARDAQTLVAFDVADPFVVQRSRAAILELFPSIDVLFANAQEAQMLVGSQGETAARALGSEVRCAVVKDGANGAFVSENGKVLHVPAERVIPIDTTGAGDMFAGGFLYGLSRGYSMDLCGAIATILGGDVITHFGVRLSAKVPERVKALIAAAQ